MHQNSPPKAKGEEPKANLTNGKIIEKAIKMSAMPS